MRGDIVMGYSAVMGWMRGLRLPRPDGLDWLIVAAAALGAALILARVGAHAGLTYDSLHYVELARNVLEGEGYTSYNGEIPVLPPGYPFLLVAAGLGIVDPYDVAAPLNAAMFGLTILVTGLYLRRRLETRFLALWACLALALALPLAVTASFAMTDMPFILFTTLALIQTDRALRDDKRSALAWAAIFCALAWQMRLIGVAVPALTGLALLQQAGMPLSRRLRRALFLGAIAGAPMALWLLRNYLLTGRWLSGIYDAVGFSLSEILREWTHTLASWIQPLPGWIAVIVFAALTLSLGIIIARGINSCVRRACLIFGGFGLAYAALLSAAIMQGYTFDGLQPRYIAALYIPLVVVAAFALDGLFNWARASRAARAGAGMPPNIRTFVWGGVFRLDRLLAIALGGGLCAWIAVQAAENAAHIALANSGELRSDYAGQRWAEANHAGPRWAESETLRYIRENLSGARIYANQHLTAHFHTYGIVDFHKLQLKVYKSPEDISTPWDFSRWVAARHGGYVVWFDHYDPRQGLGVIYLRAREGLEPVAEFADGAVFRVNGEYKPNPGASPYFNAYSAIARGKATRLSSGADFDVYVHQNTLIHFKRPCDAADVQARFFLHIFPEIAADLPDVRKGYRFENLDFYFSQRGALFDDNCVALTPLPRYESERIRTGQYAIGGGALWEADVAGTVARRYWQAHKAAADGDYGGAMAQSNFDIYIDDASESKALIYVKERCAAEDTRARFFLHVFPGDASVLPADGAGHGFDNLDFQFADYGADLGGACVAVRELPEYEVERVRTGQYVIGGDGALWKSDVAVSAGRPYRQAHKAATGGDYGGAAARSSFDIYLDENVESKTLVYVKEQCAAEDTRARFFLHVYPDDAADLSADGARHGFNNMDFGFAEYGADLGGACVAVRELPEYEVERVRTGQYVSGEGALWRAEFGVGGDGG